MVTHSWVPVWASFPRRVLGMKVNAKETARASVSLSEQTGASLLQQLVEGGVCEARAQTVCYLFHSQSADSPSSQHPVWYRAEHVTKPPPPA